MASRRREALGDGPPAVKGVLDKIGRIATSGSARSRIESGTRRTCRKCDGAERLRSTRVRLSAYRKCLSPCSGWELQVNEWGEQREESKPHLPRSVSSPVACQ